jgi:hypothetical protein
VIPGYRQFSRRRNCPAPNPGATRAGSRPGHLSNAAPAGGAAGAPPPGRHRHRIDTSRPAASMAVGPRADCGDHAQGGRHATPVIYRQPASPHHGAQPPRAHLRPPQPGAPSGKVQAPAGTGIPRQARQWHAGHHPHHGDASGPAPSLRRHGRDPSASGRDQATQATQEGHRDETTQVPGPGHAVLARGRRP